MNLLTWVAAGAVFGWLASVETGAGATSGPAENVLWGVAGALAGGYFISWATDIKAVAFVELDPAGLLAALFGALVLLTLVNLVRLVRLR